MEERLIAFCGMNCAVCVSHLAMKNDINQKGFHKRYCEGCLPRGKNCTFMAKTCDLVGKGQVRFCSDCPKFPCARLKALDKRYKEKYHLSMIDNLRDIQTNGMTAFLAKETEKWKCPKCGSEISCHNGLCMACDLEKLQIKKTYCWDEK
jgi:hypothetical protein